MDSDLEQVKSYFRRFLSAVLHQGETDSTSVPSSILHFAIDDYNCVLDFTNGAPLIGSRLTEWDGLDVAPADAVAKATCKIQSNLSTIVAMSKGKISPMAAAIQGSLVIIGDRQSLRKFGFAFKEAAIPTKRTFDTRFTLKMLDTNVSSDDNGGDRTASRSSINRNSIGSIPEERDDGSSVVYYILEVCDQLKDTKWTISRRFSDFVTLKRSLQRQGHPIAELEHRSRSGVVFRSSQSKLIAARKGYLAEYLASIIRIVGEHNPLLRAFLQLPLEHVADEEDENGEDEGADGVVEETLLNGYSWDNLEKSVENSQKNETKSTDKKEKKEANRHRKQQEAWTNIWHHVWARPVRWQKSAGMQATRLLREMLHLRQRIRGLEVKLGVGVAPSIANKWCLLSVLQHGIQWVCILVTLWTILRFDLTLYAVRKFAVPPPATFGYLKGLYESMLEFLCLSSISSVLDSAEHQLSRRAFSRYSLTLLTLALPETRRPIIRCLLVILILVAVPYFLIVYQNFQAIESPSISDVYYLLLSRGRDTVNQISLQTLNAEFLSFIQGTLHIYVSPRFLWISLSNICCVGSVAVAGGLSLLLTSERYRRAAQIYTLGIFLIILYVFITLWCKCWRLSEYSTQKVFDSLDDVVVPYVIQNLRTFRSVFIKFAQYFGARSDVVSAKWSLALADLQDACPASREAYVRRTVERELNQAFCFVPTTSSDSVSNNQKSSTTRKSSRLQFEDFFHHFSPEPLASASIGQVHRAVLDVRRLRNIAVRDTMISHADGSNPVFLSDLVQGSRHHLAATYTSPLLSSIPPMQSKLGLNDDAEGNDSSNQDLFLDVVVKVQHEDMARIMVADMAVVLHLCRIASAVDSRWKAMTELMRSWDKTMREELDFNCEASHLRETHQVMAEAALGCVVPYPIPGLVFRDVFVMTTLHGYKVTDPLALSLLSGGERDRSALLSRIAHASAHQLLVAGLFNADPHPGNVMLCLARKQRRHHLEHTRGNATMQASAGPSSTMGNGSQRVRTQSTASRISDTRDYSHENVDENEDDNEDTLEIAPGLLDFGMAVRLKQERRKQFCRLILGLFEGDFAAASNALKDLGYRTNQSNRAPERDAEFFAHLFRDAISPTGASGGSALKEESESFTAQRLQQRQQDEAAGVRERGGRRIEDFPEEFLYVSRLVGLMRGLSTSLDCSCPILHILAMHARLGLHVA